MPGICWYPAKCIGHSYESRWHRGYCFNYSSLTESIFLSRAFSVLTSLTLAIKGVFLIIAFNHLRQKIILIVNMPLDDVEVGYNKAVMELKQLAQLIKNGETKYGGLYIA